MFRRGFVGSIRSIKNIRNVGNIGNIRSIGNGGIINIKKILNNDLTKTASVRFGLGVTIGIGTSIVSSNSFCYRDDFNSPNKISCNHHNIICDCNGINCDGTNCKKNNAPYTKESSPKPNVEVETVKLNCCAYCVRREYDCQNFDLRKLHGLTIDGLTFKRIVGNHRTFVCITNAHNVHDIASRTCCAPGLNNKERSVTYVEDCTSKFEGFQVVEISNIDKQIVGYCDRFYHVVTEIPDDAKVHIVDAWGHPRVFVDQVVLSSAFELQLTHPCRFCSPKGSDRGINCLQCEYGYVAPLQNE